MKTAFLLWPADLERIIGDVLSGVADDLPAYLAEHTTMWIPTRLPDGSEVQVVMLRPALREAGQPEPIQ